MDSYGRAVPSTMYQKVKFVVEEQLISVVAEDNIDVDENVVECSFEYLKVVNAIFVEKGKKILKPRLSKVTKIESRKLLAKEHKLVFINFVNLLFIGEKRTKDFIQ